MSKKLIEKLLKRPRATEKLDPTPVSIPLNRPQSINDFDHIRSVIRREFSKMAQETGHETFEEADDFDVGDEDDAPGTRYETVFDPGLGMEVTRENLELLERSRRDAKRQVDADFKNKKPDPAPKGGKQASDKRSASVPKDDDDSE